MIASRTYIILSTLIVMIVLAAFAWSGANIRSKLDNGVGGLSAVVNSPFISADISRKYKATRTGDGVTVVTYFDKGFFPTIIEVEEGDKVHFVNMSARKMQVASENHPTHELYPELEQSRPVSRGESFDFVFEKRGVWGYHNHLEPQHKGVVVVD